MKTGLVTFYHIHHYGALLQAAATQRAVESLGSQCEIVDYFVNQNNDLFRGVTSLKNAAADVHTAMHYKALSARQQRFDQFSRDHLKISERRYESREELAKANLPYDVILAGSDQIWNPVIFPDRQFDPVFFGTFSPRRKIAYAPSFGIPAIPEGMEGQLAEYLSRFSHLSLRESRGAEIVEKTTGRQAPVVLDPTLLLTPQQWAAMANTPSGYPDAAKGYILCYCISKPGPLKPYIKKLAEETGLPVVQLCGVRKKVYPGATCILDAGPAEFLALFRNASYVCTNSFHGTVFSVQFQKPFFTAVSPGEWAKPEHSRTFSLLRRLGLERRVVGCGEGAAPLDKIDWAAAEQRLQQAREESLSYLAAALEDRPYVPAPAPAPAEKSVPDLPGYGRCTGCTACANRCPRDAITMAPDTEGFLYPVVNEAACVSCGLCTGVCPVLQMREERPSPAAFAAWNGDDKIRKDSTSGGVFSALAEDVLTGGGVVYGAAMDGRQHLGHVACFRKEDLWRLRGTKYVQSDLGLVFREIRTALQSRPVLFVGTPCQVDGLYRFLGQRPENLITCDLVCQGVPSPGIWEQYARRLEEKKGKTLQAVRFRNKVGGWQNSHFTAVYDNGTVDTTPLFNTEYGRAFGRALFLRPSCHDCRYTNLNRPGDFTLGDFWGLQEQDLPQQLHRGVNLLLVNTAHGSHVLDRLNLQRRPFPIERAVAGNPRLATPIAPAADRAEFFAACRIDSFEGAWRRHCTLPALPVRLAGKLLTPEQKEKIKRRLR